MLFVILVDERVPNWSEIAELEQIQRELQRRVGNGWLREL